MFLLCHTLSCAVQHALLVAAAKVEGRLDTTKVDSILRLSMASPAMRAECKEYLPGKEEELLDMVAALQGGVTVFQYYVCPNPFCNKLYRNELPPTASR